MANARPSPQPTTPPRPAESAKAEEWFVRYVAMGPQRSLEKLAEERVSQNVSKTKLSALNQLKNWSRKHQWQNRLKELRSVQAQEMLDEAADLDADTFLRSSRIANERMKYATHHNIDVVLKMRESVRKPAPKSGTSVNVNVSVEVQQLAEQLAAKIGVPVEDLMGDAQQLADGIMPGYQA
jgi:hypothetical protein